MRIYSEVEFDHSGCAPTNKLPFKCVCSMLVSFRYGAPNRDKRASVDMNWRLDLRIHWCVLYASCHALGTDQPGIALFPVKNAGGAVNGHTRLLLQPQKRCG